MCLFWGRLMIDLLSALPQYNVANKKVLNALNLPWLQSLVCVGE